MVEIDKRIEIIEGKDSPRFMSFGIVVSRFNDLITSNLLVGALEGFKAVSYTHLTLPTKA